MTYLLVVSIKCSTISSVSSTGDTVDMITLLQANRIREIVESLIENEGMIRDHNGCVRAESCVYENCT